MKKVSIILLSCFIGLSVWAQTPTVTIKINGNRNREVRVDGQTYTVNADVNAVNNANAPITITALPLGQHTLQVIRRNQNNNNNNTVGATTTFNLRANYDLRITVNANGGVNLSETRIKKTAQIPPRTPMTDAQFNAVLDGVHSHWTTSGRTTELNKVFATTGYYFTADQAKQLIEEVTSQSTRLTLAKTAYKTLTDPYNYTVLNDLFTTQSRRNDLDAYVVTYNRDNPGFNTGTTNTGYVEAMSSYDFNQLYTTTQNQGSASSKLTYLSNTFSSTYNYFTTAQVKQLLLLIYYENDRLTLAKLAYDNLVDPGNISQLYDVFNYQSSRNELANYIGGSSSKQPMGSAAFNSIYQTARDKWSSNAKYTYITSVFENSTNYFSVSQARQLMQLVYTDNERLQLAKLVYDNITDPGNYQSLSDMFTSQSARNEFLVFAQNNGTGSTYYRSPMIDTDFTALYNDISSKFGLGVKYSALTDVFNNNANYFTTAQARQLIQLVSAETNRLQLAKSSYSHITDPQNFTQLYDILSTQSSRDELAAWINSHPQIQQ